MYSERSNTDKMFICPAKSFLDVLLLLKEYHNSCEFVYRICGIALTSKSKRVHFYGGLSGLYPVIKIAVYKSNCEYQAPRSL